MDGYAELVPKNDIANYTLAIKGSQIPYAQYDNTICK